MVAENNPSEARENERRRIEIFDTGINYMLQYIVKEP